MLNNDILLRVRYALDIKDTDLVKIFELGCVEVTNQEVVKMLTKTEESYHDYENEYEMKLNNFMFESFLNGLIIFKRGRQDTKSGQPATPPMSIKNNMNVNNVMIKKLKIALALTSEDIIDILQRTGVVITKGELSAILRKEGHKNYKECGDKYARNFLKGLSIKYRG
ncbi:cytoplasmic protein [Virgibacillus indicus]|uniref:Cytoplasmic protein n=1 Tax=Virgibacillus indicus TaxID=2024554 RepID=A0A265N7A8_9BACI|nr:DUF1456 family protein [Virgibacillus indicus]OZU87695.1 cytoplasmic protein [Virgibacillus indicus]